MGQKKRILVIIFLQQKQNFTMRQQLWQGRWLNLYFPLENVLWLRPRGRKLNDNWTVLCDDKLTNNTTSTPSNRYDGTVSIQTELQLSRCSFWRPVTKIKKKDKQLTVKSYNVMLPISCHVNSCTIIPHHVTLFVTCRVTLHSTWCRDVMSRYVTYFQATSSNAIHDLTYHQMNHFPKPLSSRSMGSCDSVSRHNS